jgi:AcrR family transcriptional regulator
VTETTAPTRRERLREATLRDIVTAARAQLRLTGAQGLTLSAVARDVGMTAPGLYRYVDGVDGLLTLLLTEGFHELAEALEAAGAAVPREDPGGRFLAMAVALRDWARADVMHYGLLFGSPLPGYAAPEDGPTTAAVQRAAAALWQVVIDAREDGRLGDPLVTEVDPRAAARCTAAVVGPSSGAA